ncbi:carbohydrate ABC transporter permease [Paenibacillus sp. OAE614]|uniref:carbohydrate ABC transporter permease n=1 Tax=Paenibacillus sp. OAE614 TaxID=2663804 RepID=UPI003394A9A5
MKIKESFGSKLFDTFNIFLMAVLIIVMVYPLVYVFSASISDNAMVMSGQVVLWPKSITLIAYQRLLGNPDLWISYWNTIRYTAVQTFLSLAVTSAMAYPLAKKGLPGRPLILFLAAFTLMFGGGMIPTFLVVQKLGLLDTMWAIVLPSLVSTWYLFIMRTFFEGLPEELEDAATIDGCGTMQVFLKIVLPLSLPVLVSIGLFTAVNQWNSFFDALIYLKRSEYVPFADHVAQHYYRRLECPGRRQHGLYRDAEIRHDHDRYGTDIMRVSVYSKIFRTRHHDRRNQRIDVDSTGTYSYISDVNIRRV